MGKLFKLLLVFAWLPLAVAGLTTTLYVSYKYSKTKSMSQLVTREQKAIADKTPLQLYAAIPQVLGSFTTAVTRGDARPEILRQFLRDNDSSLELYTGTIVAASDENGVDYRLITAIGMCESNVGKHMPENSYNAWGYAVYTGQNSGAEFADWNHGIQVMAKYLKEKYISVGLTTPEEIGPIYAPPSVNTGNSWAKCVRKFMDELQ
jgi:hypothetical protein